MSAILVIKFSDGICLPPKGWSISRLISYPMVEQVPSMLLIVSEGQKVRAQLLPASFRYQQMYNTLQEISKLMKSARYAHCRMGGPHTAAAAVHFGHDIMRCCMLRIRCAYILCWTGTVGMVRLGQTLLAQGLER